MTDLPEAMVLQAAKAASKPLANMLGGCFMPDNGRSQRGDCADGDCYCSRVARHCAVAALTAAGVAEMREALADKVERLQAIVATYGDRIRMANCAKPEWQQEIDEALGDQP